MSDAQGIGGEAATAQGEPAPQPQPTRERTIRRSVRGPYRPRAQAQRTAEDARVAASASLGATANAIPARDDYGYYDDGPVHRQPMSEQATTLMEIPRHLIKPGWDVQWIPFAIYNEPVDGHQITLARNAGWRPAKARDFREIVDPTLPDDAPVERYGQRLFLRPLQMTLDAKAEQYRAAMEAQKAHSQASAEGRTVRNDDGPGVSGMGSVIRAVPGGLTIEGETGTYAQR